MTVFLFIVTYLKEGRKRKGSEGCVGSKCKGLEELNKARGEGEREVQRKVGEGEKSTGCTGRGTLGGCRTSQEGSVGVAQGS
jgi:hypothetical protein